MPNLRSLTIREFTGMISRHLRMKPISIGSINSCAARLHTPFLSHCNVSSNVIFQFGVRLLAKRGLSDSCFPGLCASLFPVFIYSQQPMLIHCVYSVEGMSRLCIKSTEARRNCEHTEVRPPPIFSSCTTRLIKKALLP